MTLGINKMVRLSLVAMIAASLANCAGRNEKQIEVQKRPVTASTAQPLPDNGAMFPTDTSPDAPVTPIGSQTPGTVATPIGSATPVTTTPPTTVTPPASPIGVSPVTPPVTTPVNPGPSGTTNATITVTLGNGATQQIQWDGLSDQGNTKWKIETVNQ